MEAGRKRIQNTGSFALRRKNPSCEARGAFGMPGKARRIRESFEG